MDAVLHGAALLCSVLGLACGALVLARVGDLRLALGVLLDFLLSSGLLGLAASPGSRALAAAALLVVVRKLAMIGLAQRRSVPPVATSPL